MSRYANVPTTVVTTSDGESVNARLVRFTLSAPATVRLHIVRPAERWDLLAYRYYGDSSRWWEIADANPELFDPRSLRPGVVIRVP